MKYLTLEMTYDDYLNDTLNTINLYDNGKFTEFIECTDDVMTTLAIEQLVSDGYIVRGY